MTRRILAALALCVGLTLTPNINPAPVQAAFDHCQVHSSGTNFKPGARARCFTNYGPYWASYRIVLRCSKARAPHMIVKGPWKQVSDWSIVYCPGGLGYFRNGYWLEQTP